MFDLIKSKSHWDEIKAGLPKRFNLSSISGAPTEFPCLMKAYPKTDINGFSVGVFFVTREDAARLFDEDLL